MPVTIKNYKQLKTWLGNQCNHPSDECGHDVVRVMAHRVAARVLPAIAGDICTDDFRTTLRARLIQSLFRCTLTARYLCFTPEVGYRHPDAGAYTQYCIATGEAREATQEMCDTAEEGSLQTAINAGRATENASDAVENEIPDGVWAYTGYAAVYAAKAIADADGTRAIWHSLSHDAQRVENGETPLDLLFSPLWPDGNMPADLAKDWNRLKEFLTKDDPNWEFWIWFYENTLTGQPWDTDAQTRIERITRIQNDDWEQDAEHVNKIIVTGDYEPSPITPEPDKKKSFKARWRAFWLNLIKKTLLYLITRNLR